MPEESRRLRELRQQLYIGIRAALPDVELNGPTLDRPAWRLPGNLNLSFAGVDGEALMMSLKDIAVSSGAACTTANPEPSHVLRALGHSEDMARASLRFGLGRFNTPADIELAIATVTSAVGNLRMTPADNATDPSLRR
jgi:cysteine desulfurase